MLNLKRFKFPTDKKRPSSEAAAAVAGLKAELLESTAALTEAESQYGVILVLSRADPTPTNLTAAKKAADRVTQCRAAAHNGTIAVAAAEQQYQDSLAAESTADLTARWDALEERKKTRREKAAKVARLSAEYQAARSEFLIACDAIEAACPVSLQVLYEPAVSRSARGDAHARLELTRAGVPWGAGKLWPWDPSTIKPLATVIDEADALLDQLRREAMPAAAE
jgi:hypothetical protein